MIGVGHSETNIKPSANEGDVEEVVECIVVSTKKWIVAEDELLIWAWIDVAMDPIVRVNQNKSRFWVRVIHNFNEHRPQRALARTLKTCIADGFCASH